jgi:hypothetical protein
MPAYKNRPFLDPSTPVWRHLSLNAVVATLRNRKLRSLAWIHSMILVPKKQINGQAVIFGGANFMRMMMTQVAAHYPGMPQLPHEEEDGWTRLTRYRRAMNRWLATNHAGYERTCWPGV